jgi:hypothetical protein
VRALAQARIVIASICGVLGACSGVSYREDVAALVDRVDAAQLCEQLDALDAIGPRPVSEPAATRATLDHLAGLLRGWGYEVHEEPVEITFTSSFLAQVRPADDPGAAFTERRVAVDLPSAGPHAMAAQSELLRAEGLEVDGYVMRALDPPLTFVAPNLIATRRGVAEPDQVVELSAHYDTVPNCTGGDDNGSGVVALLEVARVLSQVTTDRTVRLCFFGAEEVGLRGSAVHVEALQEDEGSTLVGLINLDAVGHRVVGPGTQREPDGVPWYLFFPDEGDFVVVAGNWPSGWLGNVVEAAIDAYSPDLPYYSCNRVGAWFRDAHRSDHANYWQAELPAVFLSDTGEFRGSHYHRPSDTAAVVDVEFLALVTRVTLAAALHLAGYTGSLNAELAVVSESLPKQASLEETARLVAAFLAEHPELTAADAGRATGRFMTQHAGSVDPGAAGAGIREGLAKRQTTP